MPIEAIALPTKPVVFLSCPACAKPFEPFLRGQVARFDWFGLRKRIWCLICWRCKEIVGYEDAAGDTEVKRAYRVTPPLR